VSTPADGAVIYPAHDCPVCRGKCAFCGRLLERRRDTRGYCQWCDITYFPDGARLGRPGASQGSDRTR